MHGTPTPSRRFIRTLLATVLVAGLTVIAGTPAEAQTPTITVTPSTDLADWTDVRITGSGFEPSVLLEWYQCRGGAVDESDCDGFNAGYISSDGAGEVDLVVPVDARIYLPDGTEVDCRTEPAGCEVGVGFMLDAGQWPTAALDFDPALPLRPGVAATVEPTSGLIDRQTVRVRATNVLPRYETWAFQCLAGAGDSGVGSEMGVRWGRMCHLDNEVRGVADLETETLDLEIIVHERFTTPFGDRIDCTTAAEGCEILVSWGFSDQPDRSASVPIRFAAQDPVPPPSTTPTTSPRPSPQPPAARPPAPPAAPIPGEPGYTG
jgi:hypothetical protein